MQPLLVLLDVDGTLFLTDDPLLGQALRETLDERFGLELPDDALARVDHVGQTSLRIGRLERLGLARFFPAGQGAFGCESEWRTELIAVARARAGDWPGEATVEVGDTAIDASSAREAGIRSLLVGQGTSLVAALAQLGQPRRQG